MRTEEDLRGAYDQLAADAPDAETMLTAIRNTERGKPRRRMILITAVATATAAAAIVVPTLLSQDPPAPQPSGAERAANPAWRTKFQLDLPAGFGSGGAYVTSTFHRATASGPPTGLCDITAYAAGAFDPKRIPVGSPTISVRGKPGYLATMTDPGSAGPETLPRAVWRYAADSWAVVGCQGGGDLPTIAKKLADGVTFKTGRIDAPLRVGYWPANAPVLSLTPFLGGRMDPSVSDSRPAFAIASDRTTEAQVKNDVMLSYRPGEPGTHEGTPVTVNGRPAILQEFEDASSLYIAGNGFEVTIHVGHAPFADPRAELIRIAEGLDLSANPADLETWFNAATAIP